MPPRLRLVPDADGHALRALIYARTSADRSLRGKSTESQVAACEDECEDRGWSVVRTVVDDDRSASALARKRREGWQDVVDAIASAECDVLVVWEFSRATRDLEVFVELRRALQEHGVLLSYKGDLYDLRKAKDRRRVSHDAVDAEAESGETSERVLRAKARDARQGWPHGPTPFGYRRVYNARTGVLERQEPDVPEPGSTAGTVATAPIVRELADRFLGGASLSQLAQDMNRRGVPTPKPPRDPSRTRGWTAATVSQVLRQPSIAGIRKHSRPGQATEFFTASWPGIITVEQREQILAVLSDPTRVIHRGTEPRHLLSHLAVCALCSVPVRHTVKRQKGVTYEAYTCAKSECFGVYCQAPAADDVVTQAVLALMADPRSVAALTGTRALASASTLDARRRLAELDAELADLAARWKAGRVKAGFYAEAASDLEDRIAAVRAELAPRTTGPTVLRLATADDQAATWDALTIVERREVVRALFEVRLHPAAVKGARRWDPTRVELLPRAF